MKIVTYSGGVASAFVAIQISKIYPDALVYFNNTKWEHEDLYRFNRDIQKHIGKEIYEDSDGRNPEQLFRDQDTLANNRMPFCSRILKADRLQRFIKNKVATVYFGIGPEEIHRAARIRNVYTGKANTEFPLVADNITKQEVFKYFQDIGIEIPMLYKLGFEHNNCSGGCVRAGKKSWLNLLRRLPDVYAERERVEMDVGKGKHTYIKDISLTELRKYNNMQIEFDDEGWEGECIGICGNMI